MTSLRRTILFWMALLLFLVGTISVLVTYVYVKEETQTSFDSEIRQIAHFLQNETAATLPVREALTSPDADNLFLIQVWNENGELIRSSDKTISAQAPHVPGFLTEALGSKYWRSYIIIGMQQSVRVSLPLDERDEQASTAAVQSQVNWTVFG